MRYQWLLWKIAIVLLMGPLFWVLNVWWGPNPYRDPLLAMVIVMLATAVIVAAPDRLIAWLTSIGCKWALYPLAAIYGVGIYVLVEFTTYHPWSGTLSFVWILFDALIAVGLAYWYARDHSPAERSGA